MILFHRIQRWRERKKRIKELKEKKNRICRESLPELKVFRDLIMKVRESKGNGSLKELMKLRKKLRVKFREIKRIDRRIRRLKEG